MRQKTESADIRLASHGPKIFISYRTREHAEYVEPLARALSSRGFMPLFDRRRNLENYTFGDLDLPLTGGLTLALRDILGAADVAVVLVPSAVPHEKSPRQRFRERLDLFLLALAFEGGTLTGGFLYRFVAAWEHHWYEIDTTKRLDENWQAWERRVSESIGVPIAFVAIPDGNANIGLAEGAVVLEPARLDEHVETRLVPRLHELVGTRRPLARSPEKERQYRLLRHFVIIGLVVAAPFIAVARLVEIVKEAFLRLRPCGRD
jgi:hypothetical protein